MIPQLPQYSVPSNPFLTEESLENFYSDQIPDNTDLTTLPGFNIVTKKANAIHLRRVDEAMQVWEDFHDGKIDPFLMKQAFHPSEPYAFNELSRRYSAIFQEHMALSDFSSLSTEVLDRMVMARWPTLEPVYRKLAFIKDDIRDFRPKRFQDFSGGTDLWGVSHELEGFDEVILKEAEHSLTVKKYRKGASVSWEAMVNDDLGLFKGLANALAIGGNNTIENEYTKMWTGVNGLNTTSLFDATNTIPGNPPLSMESLGKAYEMFMELEDDNAMPISVRGVTLVVTSGQNWVIAQNLKAALSIDSNLPYSGGKTNDRVRMTNWLAANLEIVYAPWARKLITTNAKTTWVMFANPLQGRPALVIGFLRGFNGISLYKMAPNTQTMGGTPVTELGDFDIQATRISGMTVFGTTIIDKKSVIGSNGSGV